MVQPFGRGPADCDSLLVFQKEPLEIPRYQHQKPILYFPSAPLQAPATIDMVPEELAAYVGEEPGGAEDASAEEGELDDAQFSDQEDEFGDGFMADEMMSSEKSDGPKACYLSGSCHADME